MYGESWTGEASVLTEPYTGPSDLERDGDSGAILVRHKVRVDEVLFDDEEWPMNGKRSRFPIGADMPNGTMEPMDDYRLVYDGSHA